MKKALALFLTALLLLSLASAALAVPDNVTYRPTRRFLELLDEEGIKYQYRGIDQDNDEYVVITYTIEDDHDCRMNLYFNEDLEHCSIRVWNLIDFDEANLVDVYRACDELNSSYKYIRFYVDETDYSVTASYDIIFRSTGADEICREAIRKMVNVCDAAIPTLAAYEKK